MSDKTGYSTAQIVLHWLIALLIFAAFFTHETMGKALEARIASGATGIEGNTLHVWLGGLAFVLILVRIVIRLASGAPGPVPGTSPLAAAAAIWGHRLLYLLMILTPLAGAFAWYLGVEQAGEIHGVLGNLLMIVAGGHAVVSILHRVLKNDGVMERMVRPGN